MVYEGQELNHAFGLCHYKQFLFWNEYRGGSIYKLDQVTKTVTLLRNERPPIFEIRVYDAHQQQGASGSSHLSPLDEKQHEPFVYSCAAFSSRLQRLPGEQRRLQQPVPGHPRRQVLRLRRRPDPGCGQRHLQRYLVALLAEEGSSKDPV